MKKVIMILLIISFVFSLYLSSTECLISNHNFYKKEFTKHNTYEKVYNADEISEKLIGFFQDKNNLPLSFNEEEKSHLEDVKKLIDNGKVLLIFLILISIILLSIILSEGKHNLKKILISSGVVAIILPIPFLLFSFSNIFTKFHLILFPQGNWKFPLDSLLIQMFPQEFFYDSLVNIIVNSSILAIILILIGFFSSRFGSN